MQNTLNDLIKRFMPFAQERMGFGEPPKLFLRSDEQNAGDVLGKTAHYEPDSKKIVVYISGRHPKDILRSLSHELVHHAQNDRGDFDCGCETAHGSVQNDEHMREMEREAYETGNLCFRDWEDSIKNTTYYESLQKGVKGSMSTKEWKDNELSTLLQEKWGFKFNLDNGTKVLNESKEAVEEGCPATEEEEVVAEVAETTDETVEEAVEAEAETVDETVEATTDETVEEAVEAEAETVDETVEETVECDAETVEEAVPSRFPTGLREHVRVGLKLENIDDPRIDQTITRAHQIHMEKKNG